MPKQMSPRPQSNKELEKEYIRIHRQFQGISVIALATLGIGTLFYHVTEKLSFIDSFYFSVVTLGTVGYGDIVPHTDLGKLFTSFYILVGIGIIAGFANILVKHAVIKRELRSERKSSKS
jgi:voltage-gated potassium channel Kch